HERHVRHASGADHAHEPSVHQSHQVRPCVLGGEAVGAQRLVAAVDHHAVDRGRTGLHDERPEDGCGVVELDVGPVADALIGRAGGVVEHAGGGQRAEASLRRAVEVGTHGYACTGSVQVNVDAPYLLAFLR